MRRIGGLALVLTSLLVHVPLARPVLGAPPDVTTLGKTHRQVAAMGIVKWTDFYCGQRQWTTASQAEAAALFGASLRRVNDEQIATSTLSAADRESLRTIRQLASTYSGSLLEVAARDGGTMWTTMRAGVQAAVEGLIADLIPVAGRGPVPPTAARKRRIKRLIATTESGMRQAEEIAGRPEYAAQAANLHKARASFNEVKRRYAVPTWPGSGILLDWFAARSGSFSGRSKGRDDDR